MTGKEAADWINGRTGLGIKEGLTNTAALLERLGNPHTAYPCIHVAGTNGKGSTCSMIASVLAACGYKVGMYTSPYLERFNERFRVDGEPIADGDLGAVASDVRAIVDAMDVQGRKATVFEIGTVCAFEHFRREKVDIAVIEVGIGGRLDSTNVITPVLSVIARIGLDHVKILGDTIEQIAWEKAGIVKEGIPCVLYPQEESVKAVVMRQCQEKNAPFLDAGDTRITRLESALYGHSFDAEREGQTLPVSIALPGDHQIDNARTVLTALLALRGKGFVLSDEGIQRGMAAARWAGRLEWFGNVLIEGAHNEQGAQALAAYLQKYLPGRRICAVCGIQRGKPEAEMVHAVAPMLTVAHCVSVEGHRAGDPQDLAALFEAEGIPAKAHDDVQSAVGAAKKDAGEEGVVLVFGSLYLVGTVRSSSQSPLSAFSL